MKYSIREAGATYPRELLGHGEYHSLANNAEIEFWTRIQELENALTTISTMPEYDQDDTHRLRELAKRALETE